MANPTATINTIAPPATIGASSTITIDLVPNGKTILQWTIAVTGTDEGSSAAAVNATRSITVPLAQATFTAPALACALVWTSTVLMVSADGVRSTYSWTFAAFVLLQSRRNLTALGQTSEGQATYGSVLDLNGAIRGTTPGIDGVQDRLWNATVTIDCGLGSIVSLNVNNAGAFTMAAPTNPVVGGYLWFDIQNNSGGAMGAITWNAVFKLAGAFTNPADTKRRTIRFYYNGTNWIEVSRAAADI